MTIKCPTCNGSGKATLSKKMQAVVDAVDKLRNPTSPQIYRSLPESVLRSKGGRKIVPTAINRRVQRLVDMGILRYADGKVVRC